MIKDTLECYKQPSGQEVSYNKSSILFSKNVTADMRRLICSELNVVEDDEYTKYHGMPIMVGRKKSVVFEF